MRIAFVDPIDFDFNVETPYREPLGGSQSATCYLAKALARRGHQVYTWTGTAVPGLFRGVRCLQLAKLSSLIPTVTFDAWVILNAPHWGPWFRTCVPASSKIVLWLHHAADQPAVRGLADPSAQHAHDAFVFVSDCQRRQFVATFGILPNRTYVLRNAIAPAFERIFQDDENLCDAKDLPPVIAYTSTPFRGLNLLLQLFPRIQARVPGVRLRVFSSMRVYQVSDGDDEREFGFLYEACRTMHNVEYCGSLSQPELARELRNVALLAYPNIFPETSCIVAMEAMAAGCLIVTSDLGALAETTAGFAQLVPMRPGAAGYGTEFVEAVHADLAAFSSLDRGDVEPRLRRQRSFILDTCTWDRRAREWETWLQRLGGSVSTEHDAKS
jgi:glycosyltransferase involved in cell wall biosynthesis